MSARNITLACMLLVIVIGVGSYVWYRNHVEEIFFSQALTSAGVTVPSNASLGSLELSYAQAMAERSPLFGIVGTDPSALASAVSALATSTQAIVAAQTNPQDAKLAQSLYPIDFLRSLATTEAAREAFVADDSAANERAYDAALRATASAGMADAQTFDSALQTEIGTSSFSLEVTGYPITSSLMLQSASDTVAVMKTLNAEMKSRDACLSGTTSLCDPDDIALPQVAAAALAPSSASLPALSAAVLATLSAVLPSGAFDDTQIIRLDSSVCLGDIPSPYYVVMRRGNVEPQSRYFFIGDLFFTKPWPTITTDIPFMGTYDIAYLYNDPLEFYECPETGADMSDISTIASIAQFAQEHPGLAPEDAQALEGQVADEGYARKYVTDALPQAAASSTEEGALISFAVQFNEKNADLATLVGEIATLDQFNLQTAREGSLADGNNVPQLFITHSAFPSLFLTNTNSTVASIREENTASTISDLSNYLFYSALSRQISETKLLHDLKASFDFDLGISP